MHVQYFCDRNCKMKLGFKIFKVGELLPKLDSSKVVFTNGCFDLLHPGHLEYLHKARSLGDLLVVGLNSDDSITRIKGKLRPINNFDFRSRMLSYLDFVDFVIEFEEDTPENLIKFIEPAILVKGSDYSNKEIIGSDLVKSKGGEIVLINYLEGFSSTKIITKIIETQLK
jgi:rfaE bifunctional protein nucleotidyltransferase chain/domain